VVLQVVLLIREWFPHCAISASDVEDLAVRAYKAADAIYGIEQANIWAEGFEFPEGTGNKDWADLLRFNNDLSKLVMTRQTEVNHKRFNQDRLNSWFKDDPDLPILQDLVTGMEIITDPQFRPNEEPPPFRKRYLDVHRCVNKILFEQYKAGAVLLSPTEVAKTIPGIHFSAMHWTTKPNVMKGRPLGDPSNASSGTELRGI
jgi:hypothetical protein